MKLASYAQGALVAFEKFAVAPGTALHVAELAGLGLLTPAVVDHMTDKQAPTRQRVFAGAELAGLGALAIPTIHHLMHP